MLDEFVAVSEQDLPGTGMHSCAMLVPWRRVVSSHGGFRAVHSHGLARPSCRKQASRNAMDVTCPRQFTPNILTNSLIGTFDVSLYTQGKS